MRPVFVFPGQSSCTPDMLTGPDADELVEHASDVLGFHASPALSSNHGVQLGVFLANHLRLQHARRAGLRASCSLGLSLGEYNHLVYIGALSFEDALRLVDARGRIYDEGPQGAMVAVFPLPLFELAPLVERARTAGPLEIAVYVSPTQHVVAGARAAIDELVEVIETEHVVAARVIEPRIPMHCSVFSPAAGALRTVLERTPWRAPQHAYLPNVIGIPLDAPSADDLVEMLTRHVHEPVLFRTSIEGVLERIPDALLIEVGPGRVLTNLLTRWIDRPCLATDDAGSIEAAMDLLQMRGNHGA